jgi:hypothetical protein
MNATITKVADALFENTLQQQNALRKLSTGELSDLAHECKDNLLNNEFTIRTAAHIINANCEFILAERGVAA